MRRSPQGALRRIKLADLVEHVGWCRAADPSAARLRPEAPRYTSRSPGTASRCCSSAAPEAAVPSWPAAAAWVRARIRRPTLSLGKSEPTTQKQDPGRSGAGRIGAQMRPERGRPARRQLIDDMPTVPEPDVSAASSASMSPATITWPGVSAANASRARATATACSRHSRS